MFGLGLIMLGLGGVASTSSNTTVTEVESFGVVIEEINNYAVALEELENFSVTLQEIEG